MQDNSRGGLGGWMGLIASRGAAGETTTRENSTVGHETKWAMQIAQWATLAFVATPGILFGAWLTVVGVNSLLDLDLQGGDILFALVALAIIGGLGRAAFQWVSATTSEPVRILVGILGVVVALVVALVLYKKDKMHLDMGTIFCLALGLGTLYASPLLAYNMTMQLRDPYGWESPFERRWMEFMERAEFGESEDGETAEPASTTIIEVNVPSESGTRRTQQRVDVAQQIGVSPEDLAVFAAGMANNRPITEGEWGKSTAFPKGINQFRRARSQMAQLGWIQPINPNQPNSTYEVTHAGRAVFKALSQEL